MPDAPMLPVQALPQVPSAYRAGVGIMLINSDQRCFVGQRADYRSEAWQMPQGGIDAGEAPRDAALRELYEEVGTTKAVIIAESVDWLTYELPDALSSTLWQGRYRGQRQKWFLMKFLGQDSDINLDATSHPEFIHWQWVDPRDLAQMIVPFKRGLYEKIVTEFLPLIG